MRQEITRLILFALFLIFLLGWPGEGMAQEERAVKIAYSMLSKETASAWIAQEKGFFKKNGVTTSLVLIQSGTTLAQALVAGDVDIGFSAPPAVVSAVAGGADLKIILGQANSLNFLLVGQPEISKIQDLRGKKVGVSRTGSSTWIGLMLALEHFKLDPGKEKITIVNAGTDPARFSALSAKALDASIINPGFGPRLSTMGFNIIFRLNELGVPYTQGSLVSSRNYLQNHRDRAQRIVQAWVEAMQYCLNPKNRDEILKIVTKNLRLKDTKEAEPHYQEIIDTYEKKPYPSKEGLRNVIRFLGMSNPKVNEISPESLVENSFVQELDAKGMLK